MNAATLALIIQGIEAAITAAPKVAEIVVKAKELIAALFTAQLISKAQQDALFLRVDAIAAMAAAGMFPSWWQVEPDPA